MTLHLTVSRPTRDHIVAAAVMTVNADHLNKIPTYNYIAETTRFVIQILSQPWVTVENVAGLVQREHYCEIPCHDWKKPIASIDLNPTDTITWVSRP